MKGLELSERYFFELGLPMLAEKFPGYLERIAAGLVGEGSECFGFDDEISRDHDWGPSFCLWLTREDREAIGESLQNEVDKLPKVFRGIAARKDSVWGRGRTGVFEIGEFYRRFIGSDQVPGSLKEWRAIPEGNLAVATNGKVFLDLAGKFTEFRERLMDFYPEDIRLKKIACRCMSMAQSGQYNFLRCASRGEYLAAEYAKSQFAADAISMVFLLNRRYRPFYKWMHRALKTLPVLGETVFELLSRLYDADQPGAESLKYESKNDLIEQVCLCVIKELQREGLSTSASDFLLDHGPQVQLRIADPMIGKIPVWLE